MTDANNTAVICGGCGETFADTPARCPKCGGSAFGPVSRSARIAAATSAAEADSFDDDDEPDHPLGVDGTPLPKQGRGMIDLSVSKSRRKIPTPPPRLAAATPPASGPRPYTVEKIMADETKCRVPGCGGPRYARGLCAKHRWQADSSADAGTRERISGYLLPSTRGPRAAATPAEAATPKRHYARRSVRQPDVVCVDSRLLVRKLASLPFGTLMKLVELRKQREAIDEQIAKLLSA